MNTKSLLCTHQQLHDVFGSSFSETQAVDERRLYIVVAWCGRGRRTVPRMRELQCILVGRILARYDSMHRRTFRQWGEMSTRRCRPRALLGAWPPTSCHISPNIFRQARYNFHMTGAALSCHCLTSSQGCSWFSQLKR